MIGPFETGRVHHGDCLELLREIPDGSIDTIFTDPLIPPERVNLPRCDRARA